ncbi:MAG: ABC-F family ATP-binding cassette domain-containing protein, partial [Flavobacterium sp.]|nr:ABC-F family ATP-binding cassette domain-containing protein [Flavobacterium sp.]
DNITNRTIEVTMGRIYDYKAKYTHYLELRKDRRMHQQKAYDEQQRMIADNRTFIDRFKGTFSKTDAVQSRVKMLEKLVIVQVDEVDNSALKLKFPPAIRSGQYPVLVKNLHKSFGDKVIFKDANIVIERGEKVEFVGKNGEGKSTMIKAIMKQIEINSGSVEVGHNAMIGYFAQNQATLLNENATIFETIDDIAVGDVRTKIKDILGAFMFHGDDVTKKVKVLSGGEKTRLALIKLLLEPVNFLILDEPSNHLDMKTKDIIKDALRDFDGTLILVSHDRDFLDGLATKVYEFTNKRVVEHFEDITGFLANKKVKNMREFEK